MLRLVIFVSILSLVHGLVNIESQPAKVAYGNYVKFVCDVGTMENTVKWVYGGVTYFSCDPPYRPTNKYCYTNTKATFNDYYDFFIKDNSLIMILLVRQNKNDGNWSCQHGNERDDFQMDIKDAAKITRFFSTKYNSGEYKTQCNVQSELPVDVTIYAPSYQGERILYDVKQTRLSNHSVSSSIRCSERYIYCNVTNGYGTSSRYSNVNQKCPLKILYNLSPNRTFNLGDLRLSGRIHILYCEGYPPPSATVYKLGADNIPENMVYISYSYSNPTRTQPANFYLYNVYYATYQTGKYMLILKQGNIKEAVKFNLIYSTPTTPPSTTALPAGTSTTDPRKTTTVLPIRTSTIDSTTTTHQAPGTNTAAVQNRMKRTYEMDEETKIMIYLGVAGLVISLLLVLILVIVGVFWYIRIKRKPTASVGENQVYSTMQNPSNRPNPIYENLKKL